MDERRQIPRWEIKREAKVWVPQTQSFNHCRIEDMNLKGMCVSCDKQLFQDQMVKISFAIGESFDLIKVEAQIPWAKVHQGRCVYGLSFNNIADEDKDKVYQYINTHCYDQLKDKWWA